MVLVTLLCGVLWKKSVVQYRFNSSKPQENQGANLFVESYRMTVGKKEKK
jgi:hypothetical protein